MKLDKKTRFKINQIAVHYILRIEIIEDIIPKGCPKPIVSLNTISYFLNKSEIFIFFRLKTKQTF